MNLGRKTLFLSVQDRSVGQGAHEEHSASHIKDIFERVL